MLNFKDIKEIDISNLEYKDIYYDKKIYKRAYPICIEKYDNLILLTDVIDKENVNTTEIGNGILLKIDLINREILSRKVKLDIGSGKYICRSNNTVEYPKTGKLKKNSELYKVLIPDNTSEFEKTIFSVISKDSANLILMNTWKHPSMQWYTESVDIFNLLDDRNSDDNSVLDYLNRCGPAKMLEKVQHIFWNFSFSKEDCIKEGLDLENFAQGYFDLVKNNKCMVLFLRHKDDINKCICTLEFNSDMTKLVNTSCKNDKALNLNPFAMEDEWNAVIDFCKDNDIDCSILTLD